MKPVFMPKELAESDAYTINDLGVSGIELMARAGKSCVGTLLHEATFTSLKNHGVIALAGTGNNGGDAFVMAEILRERGIPVEVFIFGTGTAPLKPDARHFFEIYKEHGGIYHFTNDELTLPEKTGWILDGLLGTGLSGPPRGVLEQWISTVNQSDAKTFAIDIPSGAYPGCDPEKAIKARLCVTFQALKPAHVIAPTCFLCGKTYVADIGISSPKHISASMSLIEASDYILPTRESNSHKGSYGTLAILGGARGMEGAAALSGLASLRSGCGKTRIYSNKPDSPKFHHSCLMLDSWEGDAYREHYATWIVGPGLSRTQEAGELIQKIHFGKIRTLWDADGLTFFPEKFESLQPGSWVMTPHPGEAAALLGTKTHSIQKNRINALQDLGEKYPGGWIVLKGARTMMLTPEGHIYVFLPGNPALAVAGSGDVLAGMIGGRMAWDNSMENAILQGILRHALTSETWALKAPVCAMLPEDMIDLLATHPSDQPCQEALSVHKGLDTLYEPLSDSHF
jgi:NAD(P)H-hydrate epimerase